jgi:hypothetical protein
MKNIFLLFLFLIISGCSKSANLEFYANSTPKVDIKDFFSGKLKATGIVQDYSGKVVDSFVVDMVGTWKGDEGVLDEKFVYNDGRKQTRIWKLKKINNQEYEGTAGDILGVAKGKISGNAINWHYSMDLPVDNKTYKVKFDDWMWKVDNKTIINRSYIKKLGITVAEVILVIQKQ